MSQDVVVIGGGVIGLFTARELVEAGHRVHILERSPSLLESCASGSAGMIVPSHIIPLAAPGMPQLGLRMMLQPRSPFYIQPRADRDLVDWGWRFLRASTQAHVDQSAPLLRDLHFASHRLYQSLAAESQNAIGLKTHGSLILTRTEHGFAEEQKVGRYAKERGVQADCLSPEEARAIDPNIAMDIAGAIYYPDDAHLSPQSALRYLAAQLQEAGVTWQTGENVSGWRRDGARVIAAKTPTRSIEADCFVLAGGAWSSHLCRELGTRVPLMPGRGYSWTLPAPREIPRCCAILHEARVAVTPIGGTLRFGGTMELTRPETPSDPERARHIIGSSLPYYPNIRADDFTSLTPWSGLRPCSPDGIPYIGRLAPAENVFMGGGHGMMGLSLGPITGRLLAQMISGQPLEIDSSLMAPNRFAS